MDFETPIKNAPEVKLQNGTSCIPQHYLSFNHTLKSVEEVVAKIEFDESFPIFVCQNDDSIYLQVGIIGFDNYKSTTAQENRKIVYGRKWRVETELPTSEIIQTAFLAIKTAREHEIRELVRLRLEQKQVTPFNNHHDLPLLANNEALVTQQQNCQKSIKSAEGINNILCDLSFNDASVKAKELHLHGTKWIIDFELMPGEQTYLPELVKHEFTLVFSSIHANALYHQLMKYFIELSDKYVRETFTYCGFNRFSEQVCIEAVGRLSAHVRDKAHYVNHYGFSNELEASNYDTDMKRVPALTDGPNSRKIEKTLQALGELAGIPPILNYNF